MLIIACVKWGTKYAPEYVNHLHDMVRRNLAEGTEGRFVCLTDDATGLSPEIDTIPLPTGLRGWWNKLALFKPGMFPTGSRVVYFDLDTVITGGVDDIVRYAGEFCILRDFYRRGDALQSSVMAWRAGYFDTIWTRWDGVEAPGGDQDWIERHFADTGFAPDRWQDIQPGAFVSYKADRCKAMFPKGARVVVFHGEPRPHDVRDGWVPKVWCIGGGTSIELEVTANVDPNILVENARCNSGRFPWLEPAPAHGRHVVLVGGGPSLAEYVDELKFRQSQGQWIWALNGSWRWLEANGIRCGTQVLMDARPENVALVAPDTYEKFYASQVAPEVLDAAKDGDVWLWHVGTPGMAEMLEREFPARAMLLGGGTTVGILAMSLAYALGFRFVHLYGFDSSYRDGEGHAYPQALNDGEKVVEVQCDGETFRAAPWMVAQADEFAEVAPQLHALGVTLTVHGTGLLPKVAASMVRPRGEADTEIEHKGGLWWPSKDIECRPSVEGTVDDLRVILAAVRHRRVAVQAGGNVGVWPKALAKEFNAVYTFEPDWLNFRCLSLNVTEPNVVKLQAALGFERGLIDLARDPANCGAHYVDGKGMVPTLRIDDLGLEACDLIALDVEGYELNALRGAHDTIRKFRPVIVCEDKGLSEKYGSKQGEIETYLNAAHGYRIAARVHRDIVFVAPTDA